LAQAGGRDIFDYGFKNAGNDTITDFTLGNTKTNTNADIIDLSDLLVGYSATGFGLFGVVFKGRLLICLGVQQ
jgi:hypothetical protein